MSSNHALNGWHQKLNILSCNILDKSQLNTKLQRNNNTDRKRENKYTMKVVSFDFWFDYYSQSYCWLLSLLLSHLSGSDKSSGGHWDWYIERKGGRDGWREGRMEGRVGSGGQLNNYLLVSATPLPFPPSLWLVERQRHKPACSPPGHYLLLPFSVLPHSVSH